MDDKRYCVPMKKISLAIPMLLAASSCTFIGKNGFTEFEPYKNIKGEHGFKYRARSTELMPAYSVDSENTRMQWLQMWLDDTAICPNGYTVYERKEADLGQGMAVQNITYTGLCK